MPNMPDAVLSLCVGSTKNSPVDRERRTWRTARDVGKLSRLGRYVCSAFLAASHMPKRSLLGSRLETSYLSLLHCGSNTGEMPIIVSSIVLKAHLQYVRLPAILPKDKL